MKGGESAAASSASVSRNGGAVRFGNARRGDREGTRTTTNSRKLARSAKVAGAGSSEHVNRREARLVEPFDRGRHVGKLPGSPPAVEVTRQGGRRRQGRRHDRADGRGWRRRHTARRAGLPARAPGRCSRRAGRGRGSSGTSPCSARRRTHRQTAAPRRRHGRNRLERRHDCPLRLGRKSGNPMRARRLTAWADASRSIVSESIDGDDGALARSPPPAPRSDGRCRTRYRGSVRRAEVPSRRSTRRPHSSCGFETR